MDDNKRRILIVDDEPNNLKLMMRILKDDYILAFATSGFEAIEATEKVQPDLILLDIMMPEIDGYETCRRLKADDKTKEIPIIFVTAKGETTDETKGLELGAIDYIRKPVSPPIVKARVRNHLALKIAREEIEQKNKVLAEQNSELKKAARLREDVDRIMRHDLKSPLNVIINFPRFIIEGADLASTHRQYLETIEQAGKKMLNMINFSLDIFKIERGKYKLKPEAMDLMKTIHQVFIENHPLINQKQLSCQVQMNQQAVNDKQQFFIQAEEMLCYSMLANLVKNACEASPRKERVTIQIGKELDAIIIAIHNNGAVPEAIRAKFFEKYATFGKKAGTGLGSYSAKLIAETHGGDIFLDTTDETGTTVTVHLPQKEMKRNPS